MSASGFLLVGCGYDPEKPVYDTKSNPEDFPQAAIRMLDFIEESQVTDFDSLALHFADLYTENSDLLDNLAWKEVVDRLGARFAWRAEQQIDSGLTHYDIASDLYNMAALARPADSDLVIIARLFSIWSQAAEDERILRLAEVIDEEDLLVPRFELLREFWSLDTLGREFAAKFIVDQVFDPVRSQLDKDSETWKHLSSCDRALATVAGLARGYDDDPLTRFQEGFELETARLLQLDEETWRFECYLKSAATPSVNYELAIRVTPLDTLRRVLPSQAFVPFTGKPVTPSTLWEPGLLVPIYVQFELEQPVGELSLAIVNSRDRSQMLALDDGARLYRLPDSLILSL